MNIDELQKFLTTNKGNWILLRLSSLTPEFIYLESSTVNKLHTYDAVCKYIIYMATKYDFSVKLSEPIRIFQGEMACADGMPIECCPIENGIERDYWMFGYNRYEKSDKTKKFIYHINYSVDGILSMLPFYYKVEALNLVEARKLALENAPSHGMSRDKVRIYK